MNYIKHMNKVFEVFYMDDRLTCPHITMYLALFHVWNENRFSNPITLDRKQIMKAAKIGSLTTYTKCLRELHDWGYIEYVPSFNPGIGSRVNLYTLCTGECTGSCTDTCTANVRLSVQLPYINIYKDNKESKQENTPTLEAVLFFFKEKKMSPEEAKKFFNHYQATGWLMGGKAPIKDWQAAAEKWISNVDKFNTPTTNSKPKPSNLHAGNDKDYSEPL